MKNLQKWAETSCPQFEEQSRGTKAVGISKPRKLKPRESEGKDVVRS